MKKIDVKLIVICILTLGIIGLAFKKRQIVEIQTQVEVPVVITDTIVQEVEVPVEVETLIEYQVHDTITLEKLVTVHDTIRLEKIVKVPTEVIKEVDRIVEVERPKTNEMYIGFGYDYGLNPFFSGAGTRFLYKTKSDIMFGTEIGFRNNITNFETMTGKLKPYVGGVMYIKINKKK